MPQSNKPGVPWPEIRDRYLGGESATYLATQYEVSRQAIIKRARKEGWARDSRTVRKPVAVSTHVTRPVEVPESVGRNMSPKDRYGLRTRANARTALELARQGMPVTAIAACCGMTASAFKHWRNAELDLETALQAAYADYCFELLETINEAADRGDVSAAIWLLERHPLTRDDYGKRKASDDGGLHVIVRVPRAAPPAEGETEDEEK